MSNSIILVEDLIGWMKGFEIFLIDHYAGDTEIKIPLVSIKKLLYQCFPLYNRRASQFAQNAISTIPWLI